MDQQNTVKVLTFRFLFRLEGGRKLAKLTNILVDFQQV